MNLFSLLFCLLLCACAPTGRHLPAVLEPEPLPQLSGFLLGERSVSGEAVLAADARIPFGSRLTIEPGSTLYVLPADSTKIDPERLSALTELQVEGELVLRGTAAQPIHILALDSEDEVSDSDPLWAGIEVLPGGRVQMEHVFLARAEHGILARGGDVDVRQSRFARCRYGLMLQREARVYLRDSSLLRGEVGLFCWGGELVLEKSRLRENDEEGLLVVDGCRVELRGNRVTANGVGLVSREDLRPGLGLEGNHIEWQSTLRGDR